MTQHDEAIARIRYEESIGILQEIGFKPGLAAALLGLATVACRQRDYATARSCYTDSLAIRRDLGNKQDIADTLEGMAELAAAQSQPKRAAQLLGAAQNLRDEVGTPLHPPDRVERDRIAATARAQLGEDAFAATWAAGRAMTLEQAIAYALERSNADSVDSIGLSSWV